MALEIQLKNDRKQEGDLIAFLLQGVGTHLPLGEGMSPFKVCPRLIPAVPLLQIQFPKRLIISEHVAIDQ